MGAPGPKTGPHRPGWSYIIASQPPARPRTGSEANSKHTKAAHHQRPSARIQEVDWDTCDAGSEEAPVGDTG